MANKNLRPLLRFGFIFASLALLLGCGGGGGGGGTSFPQSADVSISADPSTIDLDDYMQITINISNVNPNGIGLRLMIPDQLRYVKGTSSLTVDGQSTDIEPKVDGLDGSSLYLVYYLKGADFGQDATGEMTLQLKGDGAIDSAQIEVSAVIDDPTIPEAQQFDLKDPEFVPDDSAGVTVIGPSSAS